METIVNRNELCKTLRLGLFFVDCHCNILFPENKKGGGSKLRTNSSNFKWRTYFDFAERTDEVVVIDVAFRSGFQQVLKAC
jgi:hypothetical protein